MYSKKIIYQKFFKRIGCFIYNQAPYLIYLLFLCVGYLLSDKYTIPIKTIVRTAYLEINFNEKAIIKVC